MRSRLASTARGLTLSALALTSLLGSARASTPSANLASLSEEFWQGSLEASPTFATSIGDPRYDDRLADISPAGVAREIARLQGVLVRAREIPDATLSSPDRLTRTALITELENQLAQISCKFEEWVVDPMGGPQVMLMSLPDYTRIETPKDAAKFVKRIRTSGRYFDDHIANLISGLEKGRVASRDAVQKTIQQLERLAKTPDESLAVWKPALAEHPGWASADRQRFSKDLRTAIATTLRPALARYHALLSTRVLASKNKKRLKSKKKDIKTQKKIKKD